MVNVEWIIIKKWNKKVYWKNGKKKNKKEEIIRKQTTKKKKMKSFYSFNEKTATPLAPKRKW